MDENKKLKILLTTFLVSYEGENLCVLNSHLFNFFCGYLPKNKIDLKFLCNEDIYNESLDKSESNIFNTQLFSIEDIKYVFPDCSLDFEYLYNKVYTIGITEDEQQRLNTVVKKIIGDWQPDIILCNAFTNQKEILGKLFPDALCLSMENSVFSRKPFNRTFNFDPINSVPNNFMSTFYDKIKQFAITKKQNIQIEKFKKNIRKIIDTDKDFGKTIKNIKKKFKKTVLLPLSGDFRTKLFKDSNFNSDKELTLHVLENLPSDVGVFVTQHDVYGSLSDDELLDFSNKYKNFIYLPSARKCFIANSLKYYKYVDCVLNKTSKAGITGLFWDKPILSLSDYCNELIKDGQGMKDIEKVLKIKKSVKNNILYWYLTHYTFYLESFSKDNFLYDVLCKMLEQYRKNGVTPDFYEQNYTMKEVHNYIIRPLNFIGKLIRFFKLIRFLKTIN